MKPRRKNGKDPKYTGFDNKTDLAFLDSTAYILHIESIEHDRLRLTNPLTNKVIVHKNEEDENE